jgi:hypothetical protein
VDGDGQLRIRMTDTAAFEMGKNVATTPGKVVFQNDLIQLIQYDPATKDQYKKPLLIVPPWINKYYILDLRDKNSMVKWATDQGHTTFVMSWVNPDEKLAHKSFEDYVLDGSMAAIDAVEQATGEKEINLAGYCLGGTLLMTTLAYMAAKKDKRAASATFFTTMLDFSEPGELGVFIDEGVVTRLEKKMAERGYLEGSEMATTFNMLRANDLIWSFVVNNYLMGKDPSPSTCSTGTATRRACRAPCTASTCATCTSATSCANRAASRSPVWPSTSRRSKRRATSSRPSKTTSRRGRAPTKAPTCLRVRSLRARRLRPHCRHRQPASSQQVWLLDQRRFSLV